jgi:tetratricopeptide (TPR) repeat protein
MSDQYSYGDDGPAYGDDGPAYGDDGPAYGDEGPAYGDHGPAYDDEVVYGDDGPIGEGQPAYEEEAGYQEEGYGQEAYDEAGAAPEEDAAPAKAPRGPGAKRLALIGAAVLGLVGVGGAGYMMFAGDGDPMAVLRGLPVVGDMLGPAPAPDAKAPAGKDGKDAKPDAKAADGADKGEGGGMLAPLWALIPGGGEGDEAVFQHSDNLTLVQAAISAYEQEHHALPSSVDAIKDKLREMGAKPMNPYNPSQPLVITKGDLPSAAGAMAYTLKKGAYQLHVGDKHGQPLKLKGVELVLEGTGAEAVAEEPGDGKKPTPKASAEATASTAALPKPKDAGAAKGLDSLGGVIPSGASPLPSAGPPGSPPPVIADAGQVPFPGASLSPRQVFELRVKRNREFDFWRIKGITLIYSKRTTEALEAFKKALAIRPNDESVTAWVNTINDVIDKRDREAKEAYEKERETALKDAAKKRGENASTFVPPPPVVRERPAPKPPRPAKLPGVGAEDASKMLEELKKADKVPMLAPPKLDP